MWVCGMWISQGGCGYGGCISAKVGVGMVGVDRPRWVWVWWLGQSGCGYGGCRLAKVGVGIVRTYVFHICLYFM